jgi:hypothetical protein
MGLRCTARPTGTPRGVREVHGRSVVGCMAGRLGLLCRMCAQVLSTRLLSVPGLPHHSRVQVSLAGSGARVRVSASGTARCRQRLRRHRSARPRSGVFALASTAPGLIAGNNGDEVDDHAPDLRAQRQERAELGGGDPGIADHGQHLGLVLYQVGLLLIEAAEEEGRPHVRAIASIRRFCGLVACPLRSFQMVVWETGSPVVFRIRVHGSSPCAGAFQSGS